MHARFRFLKKSYGMGTTRKCVKMSVPLILNHIYCRSYFTLYFKRSNSFLPTITQIKSETIWPFGLNGRHLVFLCPKDKLSGINIIASLDWERLQSVLFLFSYDEYLIACYFLTTPPIFCSVLLLPLVSYSVCVSCLRACVRVLLRS